jgi:glutathione S-transferase
MTWELISATPSPYARKVRIALQEKSLPFELKTEVPWDHTTQTPQYNPLEKLPVLIFNDGRPAVYESHFILEWLETQYPEPSPTTDFWSSKLKSSSTASATRSSCLSLRTSETRISGASLGQIGSFPWEMYDISMLCRLTFTQPNAQSRRWSTRAQHVG